MGILLFHAFTDIVGFIFFQNEVISILFTMLSTDVKNNWKIDRTFTRLFRLAYKYGVVKKHRLWNNSALSMN